MKRYILFVVCIFLSVIAKSQTIHWITFIDTEDSNVGHINTNSRRMLYNQFINVVNAALREKGYKSDIQEFSGSDFCPETCKAVVEQLSCRAEDIVMFYYIGQGIYQAEATDKFPQMVMGNNLNSNKYMPINWVHNKLKTKRAKLTCTICVSYNGTISNTENQDVLSTKREVDIFKLSDDQLNAIQEMFTSSEGDFIISSSARGQSSFGDATNLGSVDLLNSSLATRIRKGSITTDGNITSIFKSANDNVIRESDGKQTPIYKFNITAASSLTNTPPSSIPSYQLTLNLHDRNDTKNKLTECFDNIIDSNRSVSQRIDATKKAESVFSSSATVNVLSQNGEIVDREEIVSFLERISTQNNLLKISLESFKSNESVTYPKKT